MDDRKLLEKAAEARKLAYAPYSHFAVGAALLTEEGKVYKGCNIESASYSPSNCAERTAFFKAVSEGERRFKAIAIVGGREGSPADELCPPCGVCRQVMMEFCSPDSFRIILADGTGRPQAFLLKELLPLGFGPKNLGKKGTE
ncbi:MAG TPA: cytidine deaminase [Ruminococcaceae bacterium]|jgi:cytidine deaminase|nr:cytidine deaminase [Oscillospiraceae bacterium]